jgi:hypothetical protein
MLKITYLGSSDSKVSHWISYWEGPAYVYIQTPTLAPLKIEEVPDDPNVKTGWLLECTE